MMTHSFPGRSVKVAAVISLLVLLSACAGSSSYMRDVATAQAGYAVKPDKALVVFMRPSGMGFAVQSSVFDVTTGQPEFIGIISAKTKLAHYAPPGKRTFMVVSESADFLGATLDPGKAYYALVTPRMGMWRARFSLRGISGSQVDGKQFADWYKDCRWVENTQASREWAQKNMHDIGNKLAEKLPQWQAKAGKPMLETSDGRPSLEK